MGARDSGQAAVEAALTLPLMVFLFLGTLQLFLCYQARLLAVYAASRAVSAGSRNHGDCASMNDAALAALLPAIESFSGRAGSRAAAFAAAFRSRAQGLPYATYSARDGVHDGTAVFWLIRDMPMAEDEETFDLPGANERTLTLKLVFWYPMRVPFANWVLSAMFRAQYGLQDYLNSNPLMSPQKANWQRNGVSTLEAEVGQQMQTRAVAKQYVFPVTVGWAMRMMTPSRQNTKNCAPAPGAL